MDFLLRSICCCLLLSVFASAYAEETTEAEDAEVDSLEQAAELERIGGLNEQQLQQLAIAEEVKEHEVVWLDVTYPEDDQEYKILALEQRPRAPKAQAQGAVILLHDKEQHADWPYLIRPLRLDLPDSGWYTLAVNLPYDDLRNIPERELGPKEIETIEMTNDMRTKLQSTSAQAYKFNQSNADAGSEGGGEEESEGESAENEVEDAAVEEVPEEDEESVDIDLAEPKKKTLPYRERAQFHVKAAVEHASQKGYRNIIIIGYRAGADIALDYVKPLASSIRKQGFGLVLVDPKLQIGYQRDLSSALGENFRAPVLDVVNGSDLDSRIDSVEREAGARIANAQLYRQIRLVANESGAFQQTLVRRVRSWLLKYAPGMSAKQFGNQNNR